MKAIISLVLVVGATCTALTQAPQQPTLTIETKSPTFEVGQQIQVHIVLKNTTERAFTVFRSTGGGSGEQYYSICVTGPNGNSAAFTEYGAAIEKNRNQIVPLSRKLVTVAPGEETDEYALISRMFEMTTAGTYTIQASRASPLDSSATLKSNVLTITLGN